MDFTGSPLSNYHMKTLLLYESEKHPRDEEWTNECVGDRIQVRRKLKKKSLLKCVTFIKRNLLKLFYYTGNPITVSVVPTLSKVAALFPARS